ncbi:MAG: transposase [Tepidiformaceae bacterium]
MRYNGQAAVDAESKVIVACELSAAPPDVQRLIPMLERITELNGQAPSQLSADAGYASEANFAALDAANVHAVVALRRYDRDDRQTLTLPQCTHPAVGLTATRCASVS